MFFFASKIMLRWTLSQSGSNILQQLFIGKELVSDSNITSKGRKSLSLEMGLWLLLVLLLFSDSFSLSQRFVISKK